MAIDMWSLGCILVELSTGYALLPGEDEADQLACMIELLGMPPETLLEKSKRLTKFFHTNGNPRYCRVRIEDGEIVLRGSLSRRGKLRGPPGYRDLKNILKSNYDPIFVSFLRGCLEWDPDNRITPAAALRHSWFRRRLPRPPNSTSSPANSSIDVISSNNHIPNSSVMLRTSSTNNLTTSTSSSGPHSMISFSLKYSSSKNNLMINNSISNFSNNSTNAGGSSSNSSTGCNNNSNTIASPNKLRVQLNSDESSLTLNNRSNSLLINNTTTPLNSSTSSILRTQNHLTSITSTNTTKLPQIQQTNTVT